MIRVPAPGQCEGTASAARADDRRVNRVLFVAGFSAFALLYASQGMLPAVGEAFAVSPAAASLTVSLTTLPLAVGVVVGAALSERHGRRRLLVGALLMAAGLSLVTAASQNFATLLVLRALTGLSLAGMPAVAMAYLIEEVRGNVGAAMGLYISATGLGGLAGRLAGGLLAEEFNWRVSMAAIATAALIGGGYVAHRLPASRNFQAQPDSLLKQLRAGTVHLSDPLLRRLFFCGFLLMGGMVAFFNFLQYRIEAPPFHVSQSTTPLVFLLYLAGTFSANWMGRLTDRRGRRSVLILGIAIMLVGLVLTLPSSLAAVLVGTALVTFGFFGAHANVSSWVNLQARQRRAQASSLYLLFYHLGSSMLGFAGGIAYIAGWNVLVLMIATALVIALVLTAALPRGLTRSVPAIRPASEP